MIDLITVRAGMSADVSISITCAADTGAVRFVSPELKLRATDCAPLELQPHSIQLEEIFG